MERHPPLSAGPDRTGSGYAFAGRLAQLGTIAACAGQARSGYPGLVAVTGEPGIGKTALMGRAARQLDGFTVLRAACDPAEQHQAFEVVHQLVAGVPADRLTDLPLLLAPIPGELRPGRVGEMLLRLVNGLGWDCPVAIVVDDLQWADPESVQALTFLLRRIEPRSPLLVLVGVRTTDNLTAQGGPAGHWLQLTRTPLPYREIRLSGLDRTELEELAGLMVPIPRMSPDSGLAAHVFDYTGGHPLYASMVLNELTTDEQDRRLTVPRPLLELVAHRLAALPESSRRLLEAIAVLDNRCRLGLAGQVADVADPATAVEPLVEAGLVRWWPDEPASPLCVRHPLLRAAIYRQLDARRRSVLHQAAAGLVEDPDTWWHRVSAASGVDPALASELDQAAEAALSHQDVRRAVTHLAWAADLSDSRAERERRLLTAAVHRLWHSDSPEGVTLDSIEDTRASALRSCALGLFALRRWDAVRAQALLGEASAMTALAPVPQWLPAMITAALAASYVVQGDGERAVWFADRTLDEVHRADPYTIGMSSQYLVLGTLFVSGPRTALDRLSQVDEKLRRTTRRPVNRTALLTARATCRILLGELRTAATDADAALHEASSSETADGHPLLLSAITQYLLGDWAHATTTVGRALARPEIAAAHWLHSPVRAIGALLAAGRADRDLAKQHIAAMPATSPGTVTRPEFWHAMAEAGLAQAQADYPAMVSAFDRLRSHAADDRVDAALRVWRPWYLPLLAESLIGVNRLDEAQAVLTDLASLAEDNPFVQVPVAWLSGWLAARRGDLQTAGGQYEKGIELPSGPDDVPLHRARLEQSYGRYLASRGDHSGALTWLRRAQTRYAALGANAFLDRCSDLIVAMEAPPGDVGGTGLTGLTDREREVARLAAGGMTNHQVATRLYVSEKTVEYHLGNVYAKLKITSRRQLRDHPAIPQQIRRS